jgi:hypothetical protein
MTAIEFSDQFDVMYNNIMSNAAPGLNEYEKSVFLTKAQDEVVKNYFNPKGNKYQEGFDGSAKRQIDFSKLMKSSSISLSTSNTSFDARAKVGTLPSDVLVVINEVITLTSGGSPAGTRQVIPITYEEYTRLMSKPYKEPLKNQAWRLITGQTSAATIEVIINNNDIAKSPAYKIRYVRKPNPIVVANLASAVGDGVSVNGVSVMTECELDASIHQEILQRAVELAKAAYATDQSGQAQLQNQMTVGQRSE